ncbi:hypothetical protein FA95DRAFT_924696 [Auriscalpium vulgare]|uniref:Uncharacterized protein n=1 Tax=Auriscalpium vulgare TaxID=40419 RepID=A0ACB8RY76_9AGAM|nr:hypothetical protein FA95DRAFT_924696 [Auriscalpium vulgare]
MLYTRASWYTAAFLTVAMAAWRSSCICSRNISLYVNTKTLHRTTVDWRLQKIMTSSKTYDSVVYSHRSLLPERSTQWSVCRSLRNSQQGFRELSPEKSMGARELRSTLGLATEGRITSGAWVENRAGE